MQCENCWREQVDECDNLDLNSLEMVSFLADEKGTET